MGDLVAQLRQRDASTRVLFMTGYARDPRVLDAVNGSDLVLEKPFTPARLLDEVARALARDDVRAEAPAAP